MRPAAKAAVVLVIMLWGAWAFRRVQQRLVWQTFDFYAKEKQHAAIQNP